MRISSGFLVLLAWLNFVDHQKILPLVLLAAAIHEGGHYLALWAVGGEVREITLTVVGAEMEVVGTLSYGEEIVVALAGPVANFLVAFGVCHHFPVFAGIHLGLGIFNLLPLVPLDGGRALQGLLGLVFSEKMGEGISRVVHGALSLCVLGLGVVVAMLSGGVTLLILGIWLSAKA